MYGNEGKLEFVSGATSLSLYVWRMKVRPFIGVIFLIIFGFSQLCLAAGPNPENTINVGFHDETLWDLYKWQIIGGIILVFLQSLLIVGLLTNRIIRKRTQAALAQSEERFRTIVVNTPVVIFAVDTDGIFTLSEGLGLQKLGLVAGQVVGISAFEVYKEYPDIVEGLRRSLAGEAVFFDHNVGGIHFDNRMVPVFDGDGKVKAVFGLAIDITGRVEAEKHLQQSHQKITAAHEELTATHEKLIAKEEEMNLLFQEVITAKMNMEESYRTVEAIFNAVNDAIIVTDGDSGDIFTVNHQATEMFGYSESELKKLGVAVTASSELQEAVLRRIHQTITEGPQLYERETSDRYGNRIILEIKTSPVAIQGKTCSLALMRDITARRKMEQDLQREKNFTDAVLDSIPGLLYLYDEQGCLVRWNKQHETLTGYSAEEMARMKLLDWYEGDAAAMEHMTREAGRAFADGYADAEENLRRKDGSRVPMYFTAVRLDLDGRSYIAGIGIDIAERKKTEQALKESHDNLERNVEIRTQELTAVNEELRALNEEMIAMNEELVHTNERLQTMQSYLVQSEKMAALGSLVAGVAHEINTPIGVGVTAASHLNDITDQFQKICITAAPNKQILIEYVEDINEAAVIILKNLERANRLIKSFKQVSVDQSSESRRSFLIREYLDEILLSLNPQLRKTNLTVVVDCDPLLKIASYPGALAQIVTNLVMNSLIHAYEPDVAGQLRITVEMKEDTLELRYFDDGKGMEPAVSAQIFEPFFTTRRGSGGTGLGMFVVYNIIVRQLEGTIDCQSEPGRGTGFRIAFPCRVDL